jgi:hypothetical protein
MTSHAIFHKSSDACGAMNWSAEFIPHDPQGRIRAE